MTTKSAIRACPVSLHVFDGDRMADQVFETHRGRLHALAYRMLGSHADAEDAVQDVWLRWRATAKDDIRDATAWLVRVCSNICLDVLKSARRQRENYVGQWLPEPWAPVVEAEAENNLIERDGLGQAYVMMLERLGPVERVALVLHDVFDWSHEEIAPVIERTENNTRQILFRARRKVNREHDRDPTPVPDSEAADKGQVTAFVDALIGGDLQALIGQLAPNVIMHSDSGGKAPAAANPIYGAEKVARFFTGVWRKKAENAVESIAFDGTDYWLLLHEGDSLVSAVGFAQKDGAVVDIFVHRNPDKLVFLQHLGRA